jgi:hypothetical protein
LSLVSANNLIFAGRILGAIAHLGEEYPQLGKALFFFDYHGNGSLEQKILREKLSNN